MTMKGIIHRISDKWPSITLFQHCGNEFPVRRAAKLRVQSVAGKDDSLRRAEVGIAECAFPDGI
jgi:hypothetical protein